MGIGIAKGFGEIIFSNVSGNRVSELSWSIRQGADISQI